jgi:hypothetical protein
MDANQMNEIDHELTTADPPPLWAAIEAALDALPKDQTIPPPGVLPYWITIPEAARELRMMGSGTKKTRANDEQADIATTTRELKEIANLARKLKSALDTAHAPALSVFRDGYVSDIRGRLNILGAITRFASPPPPTGPVRGRKNTHLATKVAIQTAQHYRGITGLNPTVITPQNGKAHGPFIDLLAIVFDTCGIKESVESQARKAVAAMEKMPPKKTN